MLTRTLHRLIWKTRFLFVPSNANHSKPTSVENMADAYKVYILPALTDNYTYLIVDNSSKETAVIDPVEPDQVMLVCNKKNLRLTTVLTTHHHWDHAGGNKELVTKIPNLVVCGFDERISGLNRRVKHGDEFKVGSFNVKCFHTPCHTSGHICYYVSSSDGQGAVFTGDTLFVAGCGKFFEGDANQMYNALVNILGSLPDTTKVYCGHEYTVNNLKFALTVDPENENVKNKLQKDQLKRADDQVTVPSTIGEEKLVNPFMRVNERSIQDHCKIYDPIQVMDYIRKKKDNFAPR